MNSLTPDMLAVTRNLMEGLDTPRSLAVWLLAKSNEWGQISNLEIDPRRYTDSEDYWRDCMATEFFRKCADFSDPKALSESTFNKWAWAEHQCKRTNLRLDIFHDDLPRPCLTDSEDRIRSFVLRMRKNILEVIGSRPPAEIEGRFGPGATVSDPSGYTTPLDKITSVPTLTPNATRCLIPWSGTKWRTAQAALGRSPESVRGNTYFTVPKSAKTLRACAKGASINGFYQLGVGSFLKRCLRKAGLDLFHGQQLHKEIAHKASLTGEFATIDLTSASDCMATSLVKLVLPPIWHDLLAALREPFTSVDGKWYKLEKFSAMGNGFTFELETLIFYAIAKAVRPSLIAGVDLFVYGDDIIVPTDIAQEVISALKFFGFTPNSTKTHIDGPFRESCGGDYFNGRCVRAAYIEELPYEPQHYISLANSLRRACQREAGTIHPGRFDRIVRAWFRLLDCLPSDLRRLRGPEDLGDLAIHDVAERWITRSRNSIRYIRVYRPRMAHVVRWDGYGYEVQFAGALYGVATNLPTKVGGLYPRKIYVASRQSVVSYKVGWTPFS